MTLNRVVCCAIVLLSGLPQAARAVVIDAYGAMGASETAGTDFDPTGSWVPYVTNLRGLNFGGPGDPFNVAVGGATSATLLAQNQHTQMANYVQNNGVDVISLSIGGNDFSAVSGQIINGSLSGAALTAWAQGVVDNIDLATDTVLAAHPIGMVVVGMPDIPLTPAGRDSFNSPTKIARGENAVNAVNSLLEPAVLARGQVFVDYAAAMRDLFAAPLVVGGVTIDYVNPSLDPTHFFQDGKHPAAVGNGLVANMFLEAVNLGYGTNFPLLTDLEILTAAGLASSYTGETSNIHYDRYITTPAPEPETLLLACIGGALIVAIACRERRAPADVRR